jgi:CubicO group peptidase (beta-lactamase class C family)
MSMDIQGYIVEKLSGQSLPDFMRDHIFTPLGMKDAGFFVPEDKRSRFAANYTRTRRASSSPKPDTTNGIRQATTLQPSPPCPPAAAAWSPPRKTTTASRRCSPTAASWTASASSRPPPSSS